jgi:predicted peroxiredoxin
MDRKKLGLMLSTPPNDANLETVFQLSRTALAQGNEVYLYLIDEGTQNYADARLQELKSRGLKLFVCAYGGQRFGIEPNDLAVFCGLVVLSDLVKGCDSFISFN